MIPRVEIRTLAIELRGESEICAAVPLSYQSVHHPPRLSYARPLTSSDLTCKLVHYT
jgi:hypothetical protein